MHKWQIKNFVNLDVLQVMAMLPFIRCPALIVHSSLLSDSELVLGSVAGPTPSEEPSPKSVIAGGLGGRGGGGKVGREAWISSWVKESTLGVEDGRRGG